MYIYIHIYINIFLLEINFENNENFKYTKFFELREKTIYFT